MKQLITVLSALILFSSCVTQKRCNQLFPPQVVVKDSIVKTIIVKTIIDTVKLPGDKVKIIDHAYCDSLNRAQLPLTTVSSKQGLKASVEIKNGRVDVECYYDSLIAVIKHKDSLIQVSNFHSRLEQRTDVVYKLRWWQIFLCWTGVTSLLILIVYLYFKLKSR